MPQDITDLRRRIQEGVLGALGASKALIENDHLGLKSGKHSPAYVNKDAQFPFPSMENGMPFIGEQVRRLMTALNIGFDVVAGPTEGGIVVAQWVAFAAYQRGNPQVLAVFVDEERIGEGDLLPLLHVLEVAVPNFTNAHQQEARDLVKKLIEKAKSPNRILKRGYENIVPGRRVLVVEDVTTTGGSVKKAVDAVKAADGIVVAVCCIWNRGNVKAEDIGVPVLESLVTKEIPTWPADECPLCKELIMSGGKKGVPVNVTIGHGKQFLAAQTPERRAILSGERLEKQ